MANLKEVRERIGSVKNTQQITSAMKMVSAAKMSRAAQAIQQMRPYALKLNDMLVNILSTLEGDASTVFNQVRPVNKACLVVVTSSRGLAGAFNTNVIKAAVQVLEGELSTAASVDVFCIGKKTRLCQAWARDNEKNQKVKLNEMKENQETDKKEIMDDPIGDLLSPNAP
ncbi:MAG: FoF1 ATP synthase subunit gamma, partial [Bacteroidota bacterium]